MTDDDEARFDAQAWAEVVMTERPGSPGLFDLRFTGDAATASAEYDATGDPPPTRAFDAARALADEYRCPVVFVTGGDPPRIKFLPPEYVDG